MASFLVLLLFFFPLLALGVPAQPLHDSAPRSLVASENMTRRVQKFTPRVLLSAPRRSAGKPSREGDKVLFTVSIYSFEEHSSTSQIRVLDIPTNETTVLYENKAYSEPVWVGDDNESFLFLGSGSNGTTSLLLGRASQPGVPPAEIQTFDGGLSGLQTLVLPDGAVAVVLTGLADPAGHLYNAESTASQAKAKETYSSARVYTKLFARHWDEWITENKQAIWYGRLEKTQSAYHLASAGNSSSGSDGLTNLLAGTGLESSDFALGPRGIAFVARDPAYNDALTTITNLYFVPLRTYTETPAAPYAVRTGALRGYSSSPAFSPDGRRLVFTRMANPQYESDQSNLLLVPDVDQLGAKKATAAASDVERFYPSASADDATSAWDAQPGSILWSADGATLFVTAEYRGRVALYRLPSSPKAAEAAGLPQRILGGAEGPELADNVTVARPEPVGFRPLRGPGSVSDVRLLRSDGKGDGRLFVTMSSIVDSSFYGIVQPPLATLRKASSRPVLAVVSSQTNQGALFGLSREQLGEIWFPGGADGSYDVHALVVRPSGFYAAKNAGRKWPLALLIHGGPQGAWADSWSTRWNPAVFAEQGYVVVAPNPTGSTGYGQAFEDAIQNQWGGRPYDDLVRCFDYVAENLPYVDTERAVALGASYGGYMINWIQGNPLGRRLRALVCHDGVFSTLNQYASDELFFPIHDFGGTLWDNREGYARWDPAQHTGNWATPMLVIHNDLDYRLPISEGLAMFNVLQSRNVPSKLLSFPDENHWVLKAENSLVWHNEVLGWINKYAGVTNNSTDLAVR